ncbi:hypothetical protein ACS0TY_014730 [Phlomoides rotata]
MFSAGPHGPLPGWVYLSSSDDLLPLCLPTARASSASCSRSFWSLFLLGVGASITRMFPDPRGKGVDLGYEGVLRLEEDGDGEHCESVSTMCLIGKVLTNKSFNVFGLLEAMRKAMNPSQGLTTNEIGKNLFSF